MGKHHRQKIAYACALGLVCFSSAVQAGCEAGALTIEGPFGKARFDVRVADTPQDRAIGLMHVPEMPRFAGMLFVYEDPQAVAFWMQNTLIPLDMLFADDKGSVVKVHENAVPLDLTPIHGGDAVQFVLEINGGLSAALGIKEGVQLRHPAIAGSCQ